MPNLSIDVPISRISYGSSRLEEEQSGPLAVIGDLRVPDVVVIQPHDSVPTQCDRAADI